MGLINAQRVSLFSLLNHFRTKGILHRSASTTGQRLMDDKPGVHVTAQAGFTEGSDYESNRPSYTDELVSHVAKSLYTGEVQGSLHYDILELGAGTGKFSRKILTHLKENVKYLATEPSEGFLETFKKLSPDVEAKQCDATSIPLAAESVKNIICAQCFHWFANENALKEMSRVLVPGGRILLVWNNKDWDVPWIKATEEVLTRYYDDTPRAITKQWKTVIENYKPLRLVEYKYLPGIENMKGSKEFVVGHFSSISVIARLEEQKKREAQSSFMEILDKYFKDEEINIPFHSEFYCVEKML